MGFHTSYSARARADRRQCPGAGEAKVRLEAGTGEMHALRGPHLGSVQFHLESVLIQDSERVLAKMLVPLMETAEVLNA